MLCQGDVLGEDDLDAASEAVEEVEYQDSESWVRDAEEGG